MVSHPHTEVTDCDRRHQRRADLHVARQEHALVEPLSAQPGCHLVIALARVARSACRHHVVYRVSPASGDCQDTVALQWAGRRAAVGATVPRDLERRPFFVGEIVEDQIHPALPPAGSSRPATSTARHQKSLWARTASGRALAPTSRRRVGPPTLAETARRRRTPGPAVSARRLRGPRPPASAAATAHPGRPGTYPRRPAPPG
jgi:hypothetical protein